MSRLRAALRTDLRIQARSRLFGVGLFVAVLFGAVARGLVPEAELDRALPVIYLLGIGGTTYMFGAAMILFEKSQGVIDALRVSPLRLHEYLSSKVLTLTGFALLESLVIYLVAGGAGVVPLAPLLLGGALLGASLTLLGLGQVASHVSVTGFLMPGGALVSLALQLPALALVGVGPAWLPYLVPSQPPFLVMLAGAEALGGFDLGYAALGSLALLGGAALYARRRLCAHLGLGGRA